MPITRLSVQALRILEENPQARIHSAFTSAVNLQAGERLITCSTGAISAPHGVEMSPGDLAQLLAQIRDEGAHGLGIAGKVR